MQMSLQYFVYMKNMALINKVQSAAPEIFARYSVLFAYIYGSYATGRTHPYSDLDIGIYLDPEALETGLNTELDLALELDKALDHQIETEVRAINNLPLAFTGRILTEGILLYCRNEEARIEFEVQTRKKYFDFLPVIQNYHRAYLNKARQ